LEWSVRSALDANDGKRDAVHFVIGLSDSGSGPGLVVEQCFRRVSRTFINIVVERRSQETE
jgi:hypothetical protein